MKFTHANNIIEINNTTFDEDDFLTFESDYKGLPSNSRYRYYDGIKHYYITNDGNQIGLECPCKLLDNIISKKQEYIDKLNAKNKKIDTVKEIDNANNEKIRIEEEKKRIVNEASAFEEKVLAIINKAKL